MSQTLITLYYIGASPTLRVLQANSSVYRFFRFARRELLKKLEQQEVNRVLKRTTANFFLYSLQLPKSDVGLTRIRRPDGPLVTKSSAELVLLSQEDMEALGLEEKMLQTVKSP